MSDMNAQQETYALAKAAYKAACEQVDTDERIFIERNSIRNEDGSTPRKLFALLAPDNEWERWNAALDKDPDYTRAVLDRYEAARVLREAEDALIEYGLSIAPEGLRETLRHGLTNLKIREKFIDATFRLDTSTVR